MATGDHAGLADLTFDDFPRLAQDDSLSPYERIGFPDSHREGPEEAIFADLLARLPPLSAEGRVVLDIGRGCSDLPRLIREQADRQGHELLLVDSPEMLERLP